MVFRRSRQSSPKPGYIRRRFPAASVWNAHFAAFRRSPKPGYIRRRFPAYVGLECTLQAFYASDQRERILANARQRGLGAAPRRPEAGLHPEEVSGCVVLKCTLRGGLPQATNGSGFGQTRGSADWERRLAAPKPGYIRRRFPAYVGLECTLLNPCPPLRQEFLFVKIQS